LRPLEQRFYNAFPLNLFIANFESSFDTNHFMFSRKLTTLGLTESILLSTTTL
jgi:hypothetical protein